MPLRDGLHSSVTYINTGFTSNPRRKLSNSGGSALGSCGRAATPLGRRRLGGRPRVGRAVFSWVENREAQQQLVTDSIHPFPGSASSRRTRSTLVHPWEVVPQKIAILWPGAANRYSMVEDIPPTTCKYVRTRVYVQTLFPTPPCPGPTKPYFEASTNAGLHPRTPRFWWYVSAPPSHIRRSVLSSSHDHSRGSRVITRRRAPRVPGAPSARNAR